VVVHKGSVQSAGADLVGQGVLDVTRTAYAREFRDAIAGQAFGLALSPTVYEDAVLGGAGPGRPGDYRRLAYGAEGGEHSAWVLA